jgi:hypothetical protein
MTLRFNPARGEAVAILGGVEIVLAVEMERLAQLQTLAAVDDFATLYVRLIGFHLPTVRHALATLVLRGDGKAAAAALTLNDMAAWIEAISKAFAAHLAPPDDAPEAEPRPPQAAA